MIIPPFKESQPSIQILHNFRFSVLIEGSPCKVTNFFEQFSLVLIVSLGCIKSKVARKITQSLLICAKQLQIQGFIRFLNHIDSELRPPKSQNKHDQNVLEMANLSIKTNGQEYTRIENSTRKQHRFYCGSIMKSSGIHLFKVRGAKAEVFCCLEILHF